MLGRGLRIPNGLTPPVQVIVNNHTRWTEEIQNLYKEVVEIENRVSWGYDSRKNNFLFPLFNLEYKEEQYMVESKKKSASDPTIQVLHPQARTRRQQVTYSLTGIINYEVTTSGTVEIEDAARQIKLFLKEKDPELARNWTVLRIIKVIKHALEERGYDSSFLSAENLAIIKQGFGPMFRQVGKEAPRIKLSADKLREIKIEDMQKQSYSESAIKSDAYIFYDGSSIDALSNEEKSIIGKYISGRQQIADPAAALPEIRYLADHLFPVEASKFKTPLSFVVASFSPEREFVRSTIANEDTIASFIKSPDKKFYTIPYSYKPTSIGSTHVKRCNFNPDFFLVVKDTKDMLVVEIKKDGDTRQENIAKNRDSVDHFHELNKQLDTSGIEWRYYFYFLSPENYPDFFEAIRSGSYKGWKSVLMQELER